MKDAMNDTDVLEEINSKLSRLLRLTVVSTQSLEDKLKKANPISKEINLVWQKNMLELRFQQKILFVRKLKKHKTMF